MWGFEDFRWGRRARCNTWGGKVRFNSAAKNQPCVRPCQKLVNNLRKLQQESNFDQYYAGFGAN